ncbi:Peroxisomal membrane protein PEX16 [Sarcoptes scabiei]|nr:Peroxisomal membrane protein PEX16 [Sarcoptes scabiei]UXI19686.1 hypothetical protein NH340_JMT05629 [Sarcoptes scabiei]
MSPKNDYDEEREDKISSLFSTDSFLKSIEQIFKKYQLWVQTNPLLMSEIESVLNWISFLISATKFHNNKLISELLHSCSSILTLFNDKILRAAYYPRIEQNSIHTLNNLLQLIEYVQVFLELAANHRYGSTGKWIIVSIIEISKAIIRLLLLFYYKQGLLFDRYVNPLDRKRECKRFQRCQTAERGAPFQSDLIQDNFLRENISKNFGENLFEEDCFDPFVQSFPKLKIPSIGKILKKKFDSNAKTELTTKQLICETIRVLRPLIYLMMTAKFGSKRWYPFFVSLSIDLVALHCLRTEFHQVDYFNHPKLSSFSIFPFDAHYKTVETSWNHKERLEISRRTFKLLFYLLRSPFYDLYTKRYLLAILIIIAEKIPIFGHLIKSLISYLPEWQQIYFNVWNS